MIMKLLPLFEEFIRDTETFWAWVSPDNKLYRVPKLKHKDFIERRYPKIAWDYDAVFDQAIKDGWVRVIYEYDRNYFRGDLSVNGYGKNRVKSVIKTIFGDLLRYGYKTLYIDYESPKESKSFTTFNSEGKHRLMDFLNNE